METTNKKSDNWVPLLGELAGSNRSLWVGRDCARTLFGIKVTGEMHVEHLGVTGEVLS